MNERLDINRGINMPIVFKGLKAQYIGYLCIGLLALLILFAILYVTGLSLYLILPVVGGSGFALFSYVFKCSAKYGVHGLMKKTAWKRLPKSIKCGRIYTIVN